MRLPMPGRFFGLLWACAGTAMIAAGLNVNGWQVFVGWIVLAVGAFMYTAPPAPEGTDGKA